jgi:hypothetical protein
MVFGLRHRVSVPTRVELGDRHLPRLREQAMKAAWPPRGVNRLIRGLLSGSACPHCRPVFPRRDKIPAALPVAQTLVIQSQIPSGAEDGVAVWAFGSFPPNGSFRG